MANGTNGDDVLTGTSSGDNLQGLGGNDTISGLGGDDNLNGGTGSDTISGGDGNDNITGGPGDDTIDGGAGDDSIQANSGNDVVTGGDGNDSISGDDGSDVLAGGAGDDTLTGNNDADQISGGDGDDTLVGGNGDDELAGDAGNDTISGDGGGDTITGGAGDDVMSGGGGTNTFVFNFSLATKTVEQTTWFRANAEDTGSDSPSSSADYSAWNNYDKQLDAWRAEMLAQHGSDLEQGDTYSLDIKVSGGSAKKPTTTTYHFDGDASYSWMEEVTTLQGEGVDTVLDWTAGSNTLQLNGLTAETALLYLQSSVDANGNTVISFDGGSITLVGVQTSLADLIANNQVAWG